ncbi:MAG: HAMP domain-containing sensor histidine kinase [Chitinophagaceae bacterium]
MYSSQLNDLLEEKKDLTALLSHDLRIPLRNVKTFNQLLLEQEDDSVKELAGMIYESTQEQTALLESVLEILRQDHLFFSGVVNTEIAPEQLITETIAGFELLASQKNIQLKKNIRHKGLIAVQPELFTQVLKNITSNAIKFSYSGSEIHFSVYEKDHRVHIDVSDSGMGFDAKMGERLLDRFTKSGRRGTADEPTTGIGLYLSRKIINHQRGELTAFSPGPGKGSVFSITLN